MRGAFLFAFVSAPLAGADVRFSEVAAQAGVVFAHDNGMTGERWILETVGAGAGVLDFDGDGRLDIWLVQGGPIADRGVALPGDRLFRNVGAGGRLAFEDVTAASGVRATGYGMGIATGDIDRDGDADVFLANYGANQLFENLGDGRFRDITARAGVAGGEWSVSASFADVDGDGLVDLYVGNYLDFSLDNHRDCPDLAGRPSYCAPSVYPAVPDRLWRNLGGGRFEDIGAPSGIGAARAPALGVAARDFDGDGRVDFYVANDGAANLLWLNQGAADGGPRFVDGAQGAFAAYNANGAPEAGMGVAAEDFDGDCDVDIFVTHLATETNTLYVNRGGWFSDDTNRVGLGASSGPFTGFGVGWFDADGDGDLDLFSANGAVFPMAAQRAAGDAYPLKQANQLWLNDGGGRFAEHRGVDAFAALEVSRGAAFADLDNDGDTDIVVSNNAGAARLYRNDSEAGNWVGLVLPPGAAAAPAGTPCPRQTASTDGSYASANDPRLLFRLDRGAPPPSFTVQYGAARVVTAPLAARRYHRLSPAPPRPGP